MGRLTSIVNFAFKRNPVGHNTSNRASVSNLVGLQLEVEADVMIGGQIIQIRFPKGVEPFQPLPGTQPAQLEQRTIARIAMIHRTFASQGQQTGSKCPAPLW